MQIGFCGRVLLNAFNAIEYGEQHQEKDLVNMGNEILESFLQHGFTSAGYFYDDVNFNKGFPTDEKAVHSIRQQSEAVYAILLYLKYEKSLGRKHVEWENHIKNILDSFLKLQKEEGSFARKFHDDGSDIDASGGSTPSATSALVMGYRYLARNNTLKQLAEPSTIWRRTSFQRVTISPQPSMPTARTKKQPYLPSPPTTTWLP